MNLFKRSTQDIERRIAELKTENEALAREIETLENECTAAVVDRKDVSGLSASADSKQRKARINAAAIATLETELIASKARDRVDEAKKLREQAKQKRSEADAIADKCRPLLRKLSDLTGVSYDVSLLENQRRGESWTPTIGASAGVPIEHLPNNECLTFSFSPELSTETRIHLLHQEAWDLDRKADELDPPPAPPSTPPAPISDDFNSIHVSSVAVPDRGAILPPSRSGLMPFSRP